MQKERRRTSGIDGENGGSDTEQQRETFTKCLNSWTNSETIYTIILLKSVGVSNSRSQFLLDLLGRCLKRFVWTEIISCQEFASQFGLTIFLHAKNTQNYREYRVAHANVYLNEAATCHRSPVTVDQSPATT